MAPLKSSAVWRRDLRSMAPPRVRTVIRRGLVPEPSTRIRRKLALLEAVDGAFFEPARGRAIEQVPAALELHEVGGARDADEELLRGAEPAPGVEPLRVIVEFTQQHESRRAYPRQVLAPAEV